MWERWRASALAATEARTRQGGTAGLGGMLQQRIAALTEDAAAALDEAQRAPAAGRVTP